jgi:hypothetical protein
MIKMAAASALSATLLIGSAVMGTLPASASTSVNAKGAIQCGGDLCIQNQNTFPPLEPVKAWAKSFGFRGHFELIFPSGAVRNSPTESWKAGGSGYTFDNLPIGAGYVMKAWENTSGRPKDIGDVSFQV